MLLEEGQSAKTSSSIHSDLLQASFRPIVVASISCGVELVLASVGGRLRQGLKICISSSLSGSPRAILGLGLPWVWVRDGGGVEKMWRWG